MSLPQDRSPFGSWLPIACLALLCGACVRPAQTSSGLVLPLMRHTPGDGLAVINGPGGRGIHIWLDPDTSRPGICRPRWIPDPARLVEVGGPGRAHPGMGTRLSTPGREFLIGGRAPRQEFFQALRRGPVRLALRRQMAQLCRERAPGSRFLWRQPPRNEAEVPPVLQPLWEEEHLLSNPRAVRRSEKQLLGLPLTADDWDDRLPPRPPDGP
ncbi:MAG: hypothetical protein ACKOZT_00235 [Cyanobium sp.]